MPNPRVRETILVSCDQCEASVLASVEGSYHRYSDEPGYAVRWSLLSCPRCDGPLLTMQDDEDGRLIDGLSEIWSSPSRIFPEKTRQLGQSVPVEIKRTFEEANSCYINAKAYTACAIMCRKVLEGVCESHGAPAGNLAVRLKFLADRGDLDKRLFDWMNELRSVGNEAVHDVDITVSREEAGDLLDLTEAITEYLYTFKEKFENFQKRRALRKRNKE